MSLVTQRPKSENPAHFKYSCFGAFASQTKKISLASDAFGYALSFLSPREQALAERVCKSWQKFMSDQWKKSVGIL